MVLTDVGLRGYHSGMAKKSEAKLPASSYSLPSRAIESRNMQFAFRVSLSLLLTASCSYAGDSWTLRTPMPARRANPGVAIVPFSTDYNIYVIGGWDGIQALSSVESYSPSNDNWIARARMRTPRRGPAVGVIDRRIFVAGGSKNSKDLNTMEMYDPLTDEWSIRASMPTAREAQGAVVNGVFYVIDL